MTPKETLYWAVRHHQAGRLDQASALYQEILGRLPDQVDALHLLGVVAIQMGNIERALELIGRAIALNPGVAEYHSNFGEALRHQGKMEEATASYRKAIALRADYADAYLNLGNVLRLTGQLDEAMVACQELVRLRPDSAEAHNKLANVLKDSGRVQEALASFGRAMALEPGNPAWGSNYIYTMHLLAEYDTRAIRAEQSKWDERHAHPLRRFIRPHGNDRSPNRRLKIGYVSPDFREHAVAWNVLPLLREHDHEQFEVFCYAGVPAPDALTAQCRSYCDEWRDIAGVSDEEAAGRVRADKIDILIDLTMHMGGNRLLIFAYKPAPVQATFIAYPGGTGMETMDYRLTDPYLDPPAQDEGFYTERPIRLGHSFWCYDAEAMGLARGPGVSPMPGADADIIFGCLNNFCKINDRILEVWSKMLASVGNSRLALLAPRGGARQRVLAKLQQGGADPARVEFLDRMPRRKYLEMYHRIDVFLDTFPYNGHTTCLDSLWMGVPVITLTGSTAVSRGGLSILTNVGLGDLVAATPEQYIALARDLALDRKRREKLRTGLRQRMAVSPLMDAPGFARDVEAAYRRMWLER